MCVRLKVRIRAATARWVFGGGVCVVGLRLPASAAATPSALAPTALVVIASRV